MVLRESEYVKPVPNWFQKRDCVDQIVRLTLDIAASLSKKQILLESSWTWKNHSTWSGERRFDVFCPKSLSLHKFEFVDCSETLEQTIEIFIR